ncbi:MAG: cysteine hydrolase [Opitutae bacterium]|jgi:biuret amidohydrolase|nr:cysteine hydrolase [Opitutae bacterium]MBT4224574.1 cysteine hydrolase [Opitutae bacterium]MBT5379496.1 cysteine hydrolase [Opitutae bacterium]MBT6463058.1 cysteine hydrolase [Opitutae bacterium]MBT6958567.1 cysteine hydrolase [Opitutae bacterium]
MSPEEILETKLKVIDESHGFQPGRTALIVIDMQHGFVDDGASLAFPEAGDIISNLSDLIAKCRNNKTPVIFTEFVYAENVPCLRGDPFGIEHLPSEGDPGFGKPSSNCLIGPNADVGVESAETIEELQPLPGELVIRGHTYDKFYGTPLDLSLRSQGITHLFMTGITTDVCVNSTLIAASSRNYRVTAITDGVASPWPGLSEACFQIWRPKFARLKTTAEILTELCNS